MDTAADCADQSDGDSGERDSDQLELDRVDEHGRVGKLYRATVPGRRLHEPCTGGSFAATSTTYHDTGLTAGTSYSYRVQASDTAGNLSSFSNVASATTQTPPTAPNNLTGKVISAIQINLSWTASTAPWADCVGTGGFTGGREDEIAELSAARSLIQIKTQGGEAA